MRQLPNPFLPSWEYLAEGKVHVFRERVWLYGTHDRFGDSRPAGNDLVCWSAPVTDLTSWRKEGIIFRKKQDPMNRLGRRRLLAPDVCQGPDGLFYLYYTLDAGGAMGVAVCEDPAGDFSFLGYVRHRDGTVWGRQAGDPYPWSPVLLPDPSGRVWLYAGQCAETPASAPGGKKLAREGGYALELEPDMLTIRQEPRLLFPGRGPDAFAGHEFVRAGSICRDGERLLLTYTSRQGEICLAEGTKPDGDFSFRCVLLARQDPTLESLPEGGGDSCGSLLSLGERWYLFTHRWTGGRFSPRQICGEALEPLPDGTFRRAERTSCGLNGGPLRGTGRYWARIACCLQPGPDTWPGLPGRKPVFHRPFLTQSGEDREEKGDQFIAEMGNGAAVGFRSFRIRDLERITVEVRGSGGILECSASPDFRPLAGHLFLEPSGDFTSRTMTVSLADGVYPLWFRYRGTGAVDFRSFTLRTRGEQTTV